MIIFFLINHHGTDIWHLKVSFKLRLQAFDKILLVNFFISSSDLLPLINVSVTQYCYHSVLISPPSYKIENIN